MVSGLPDPQLRPFAALDDPSQMDASLRGGAVAIGNFDGVHRGHRAVLDAALGRAHGAGCPALALTFEPHPRTFFKPSEPVFRLTPPARKVELLRQLGFDAVVSQPFGADFARLTAEEFVEDYLARRLGARIVVSGEDFHFGKGRLGTPQFLREHGARLGIEVISVEPVRDETGEIISSTRIRQALAQGDVAQANALLGRTYSVRGTVISGQKLGRTLGFPTANLALPGETELRHGIYAVRVRLGDGVWRDGVASYGRRPTFDNGEALLESFLFDFSGDLYGQTIEVALCEWLRPELKFDSAEALVVQMRQDEAQARAFLAG